MKVALKNFIIPRLPRAEHKVFEPSVCAVVPTYKPGTTALRLVGDLLSYNPKLTIVVVDDSTPLEHQEGMRVLAHLRELSPRVEVVRTPENKLKAGALNLGISKVLERKGPHAPAVVLTLDDDVVIGPDTVRLMAKALLADTKLGAACSRCNVLNKNKNLLTRLQGLEYVGFNAIRLSDQGFMRGPLVMHGMLTAFRARALRQAGPFAERHLIEDYEMTTRLKSLGWEVRAVLDAPAWTEVPETIYHFWRQRTRWSFGGVGVVLHANDRSVVLQDILGHGVFIATLAVIVLLIVSGGGGVVPIWLVRTITAISLIQLAAWYSMQLWLMSWYQEKDAFDWLLRASLVPEMLYSAVMTVVLIGSYFFAMYTTLAKPFIKLGGAWAKLALVGMTAFGKLGYSGQWGTRS